MRERPNVNRWSDHICSSAQECRKRDQLKKWMKALYITTLTREGLETKVTTFQSTRLPNIPSCSVRWGRMKDNTVTLFNAAFSARCDLTDTLNGSLVTLHSRVPLWAYVLPIFCCGMALGFLFGNEVRFNGHDASIGERFLASAIIILAGIIGRAIFITCRRRFILDVERILSLTRAHDRLP